MSVLKWFLKYINFTLTWKIYNKRYRIPFYAGVGPDLLRVAEGEFVEIFRKLLSLKGNGCFVDVGTNIGQTLLKIKAIDEEIRYVGFEANLRAAEYLDRLIESNGFQYCTLISAGASDRVGIARIFSDGGTGQGASLVEEFRSSGFYTSKHDIVVVSIDEIFCPLPDDTTISVIKIDVEGSELDVLRGAVETIRRHRSLLVCEVLPVYEIDSTQGRYRKNRQDELEHLLTDLDYSIFRILKNSTLLPMQKFDIDADLGLCNYVFAPREDEENILTAF